MQPPQSIDILPAHALMWSRMQPLLNKKRVPQALLFVGPPHMRVLQFANRLMAAVICQGVNPPCGNCSACHLFTQGLHPDIDYVTQEKQDSAIKIEQIRTLQQSVYQTPKRGQHRFILIAAADKMNVFAANALLKILEEPPAHTLFILIAEQVSSLPATILSRCQHYVFESSDPVDYLQLGKLYASDTTRAVLFKQSDTIIDSLCDLIDEKITPCTLAAQWSVFAANDLLWFLYLLSAQVIRYQLIGSRSDFSQQLRRLSRLIQPARLFVQLDGINALIRKINHNINTNQTLALENLLLGYLRDIYGC